MIDEPAMPIEDARHIADLWRAHKLIGYDPYEVCEALLREIELLEELLNT